MGLIFRVCGIRDAQIRNENLRRARKIPTLEPHFDRHKGCELGTKIAQTRVTAIEFGLHFRTQRVRTGNENRANAMERYRIWTPFSGLAAHKFKMETEAARRAKKNRIGAGFRRIQWVHGLELK